MEFSPKEPGKERVTLEYGERRYGLRMIIGTILLIVMIAGIVLLFMNRGSLFNSALNFTANYQAVFLTNGQVYFGKIVSNTDADVQLEDVYYLQLSQALQPQSENLDELPEITLVKLGNELHGPTDKMIINRDHILYMEDLKDDSRVVQAINQNKQS